MAKQDPEKMTKKQRAEQRAEDARVRIAWPGLPNKAVMDSARVSEAKWKAEKAKKARERPAPKRPRATAEDAWRRAHTKITGEKQ